MMSDGQRGESEGGSKKADDNEDEGGSAAKGEVEG
eukprot:CAMPEP_0174719402 /NCGR_PEP_ID=MMETSP1094-20130205/31035_1 /TAXON_ID=156173 /ORGANISM="Chrysochromulina brevifilum, Strain UTEX LB 985" /LENGTH=34 /DNA_ID= /DNA_START= /DNA_END= /DNA_ORIENTATION=